MAKAKQSYTPLSDTPGVLDDPPPVIEVLIGAEVPGPAEYLTADTPVGSDPEMTRRMVSDWFPPAS